MNHYECRKCAHRFEKPEVTKYKFADGHRVSYSICPLCKSRTIVAVLCAYCDFYKSRSMPCGMGHKTIVPFNISCGEWKIRSLNKPKVI